ncbi:MAG: DUF386 domain-containing protein [Spirochaetia bacterium]|nr:DUF386 domain-containing protein [Spirochaetia bacterium]
MIIDSIENLKNYVKELPLLQEVLNIYLSTDFSTLPAGKYSTKNPNIRYIVFDYVLQKEGDVRYEVHKTETDLQLVISGKEMIEVAWSQPVNIVEEYVPDIYFVTGNKALSVVLEENKFILLLPTEPHIPCLIADKNNTRVKKVVFKLTMPL